MGLAVQPVFNLFNFVGSLLQSYNMLASSFCGVSLRTMMAISVDRFLALRYHMRYLNLMTQKRALHTTFFSGLFSSFCPVFIFGAATIFFCYCRLHCLFYLSLHISHIRIYQIVLWHQLQIQAQQQAVQSSNAAHNLNIVQRKESVQTLLYITFL